MASRGCSFHQELGDGVWEARPGGGERGGGEREEEGKERRRRKRSWPLGAPAP